MDHLFSDRPKDEEEAEFMKECVDNSFMIHLILRDTYGDQMIGSNPEQQRPIWNWNLIFGKPRKQEAATRKFVPGLRRLPPFPKLSALTSEQQLQCLKVLCALSPLTIGCKMISEPTDNDYEVFEALYGTYAKEQEEFMEWAKHLWVTEHHMRVLRPKPIVEIVYDAEFNIKAKAMKSFPSRFTMASEVFLELRKINFDMTCEKILKGVDFTELPIIRNPLPITKTQSIMDGYFIPGPCGKHPCRFVLPNESTTTILPLTEVHKSLAQYALDNGVEFIASENALKCLLEVDRGWTINLSVCEAIAEDGEKRNVLVLGEEVLVRKEGAQNRTYRAFKHLMPPAILPRNQKQKLRYESYYSTPSDVAGPSKSTWGRDVAVPNMYTLGHDIVVPSMYTCGRDGVMPSMYTWDRDVAVPSMSTWSRDVAGPSKPTQNRDVAGPSQSTKNRDVAGPSKPTQNRDVAGPSQSTKNRDVAGPSRPIQNLSEEKSGDEDEKTQTNSNSHTEQMQKRKRQTRRQKKKFCECTCKEPTSWYPPPRSFNKWRLKNLETQEHFEVIIHCPHELRDVDGEVLLEPIPEYQLDLGISELSAERNRSFALSLYLRENATLMMVRMDGRTGEMVMTKSVNYEQLVIEQGEQKSDIAQTVASALAQLRHLQPGHYLLHHEVRNGRTLLYAAGPRQGEALQLDFQAAAEASRSSLDQAEAANTPPTLEPTLLPWHTYRKILPCAFTPFEEQVAKNKKPPAKNRNPPVAIACRKKKKKTRGKRGKRRM